MTEHPKRRRAMPQWTGELAHEPVIVEANWSAPKVESKTTRWVQPPERPLTIGEDFTIRAHEEYKVRAARAKADREAKKPSG